MFEMRILAKENKPVRVADEGEHSIPIPYAGPLKEELKHYISCVKGRKKPDSDGMVGMRAVVMAEAVLEASEKNKFMRFANNHYIED
jgi:UDP-N-acetylglucosamine 3-dehydrogenase